MVQRLVRSKLLCGFSGAQSLRIRQRQAQGFAGRIVAASCESFALLGAVEHPPGISVCGLWVSLGLRRFVKTGKFGGLGDFVIW
jgi:hypothetical protein